MTLATREDNPIVTAIDARMPEIAAILPDGMRPERFRKVVVQALLRNPKLLRCTPVSIVTAITEAAEVGIEPTGVLGRGWLIDYGREARFVPGWRGFVDLMWKADRLLLTPELVRAGDDFEYRRGTGQYLRHVPDLIDPDREKDDANVTFAYVMVRFPDGREDFEVMSRADLERIRDRAKTRNPVWTSDPGEMMKKTPIRRLAKRLPLSPAIQALLARDEETDFDTPVERIADPRRSKLAAKLDSRTAALRGDITEESEAAGAVTGGGAEPEGAGDNPSTEPSGGSSAKGDPWMKRLHAVGADRGMDHDALHDWAVEHFRVASLTELDVSQRATLMELVENLPEVPA